MRNAASAQSQDEAIGCFPDRATRGLRLHSLAILLVFTLACFGISGGCDRPKPAAKGLVDVSGLAAIPSDVTAVVSFDVPRLAASPIVRRGVELLLSRDAELEAGWRRVVDACRFEVTKRVRSILLAVRTRPQPHGPAVLTVVSGDLRETELSACLQAAVAGGGGALSAQPSGARTVYRLQTGGATPSPTTGEIARAPATNARSVWFAFPQSGTAVLSSDPSLLLAALGTGATGGTLGSSTPGWLDQVDTQAPLWAAGVPDPRVTESLRRLTDGALQEGPRALTFTLNPQAGIDASLQVVMASEQDAKKLEEKGKEQMPLLAMAGQARGLGPIIAKLAMSREGSVVRLRWALAVAEINQLMSAIDTPAPPNQDAGRVP